MKRILKRTILITMIFIPLVLCLSLSAQANYINPVQVTQNMPWEDLKADMFLDRFGTAHYVQVAETELKAGELNYGNNSNTGDPGFDMTLPHNLHLNNNLSISMDLIDIGSTSISVDNQGNPLVAFTAEINTTDNDDQKRAFVSQIDVHTGEFDLIPLSPRNNTVLNTPYTNYDNLEHYGDYFIASKQDSSPYITGFNTRDSYNPSTPKNVKLPYQVTGPANLGSNPSAVLYNNPYLYTASGKSILIYYVDNLLSIGNLVGNFTFNQTITDFELDTNLNVLYTVTSESIYAVDVTNPRAISFIHKTDHFGLSLATISPQIAIFGQYLYVSASNDSVPQFLVFEFDKDAGRIRNRTIITETQTGRIFDLAVNPQSALLYVAADSGIYQYSLANRTSPADLINKNAVQFNNNKIIYSVDQNAIIALSNGFNSVFYQSQSNLSNAGYYNLTNTGMGLTVSGSLVYIAESFSGLRIINFTIPTAPTLVSLYTTGLTNTEAIAIYQNTVVVCDTNAHLVGINVSTAATPSQIFTKLVNFSSVTNHYLYAVSASHLFLVDPYFGLLILSKNNNVTQTSLISAVSLKWNLEKDLFYYDGYLYIVGTDGLGIIDVRNPANPGSPVYYRIDNHALLQIRVHKPGSTLWAYILDGTNSTIAAINFTSPTVIDKVFYHAPAFTNPLHFDVSDSFLYLADGNADLQIVDIADPTALSVTDTGLNGIDVDFEHGIVYLVNSTHITYFEEKDPGTIYTQTITGTGLRIRGLGATAIVATASTGVRIYDLSAFNTGLGTAEYDKVVGVGHFADNRAIVVWTNDNGSYYRIMEPDGALGRTNIISGMGNTSVWLRVETQTWQGTHYTHIAYTNGTAIFYTKITNTTIGGSTIVYQSLPSSKPRIDSNEQTVGITWETLDGDYDVLIAISTNLGSSWTILDVTNSPINEMHPDLYVKDGGYAEVAYSRAVGSTYTICMRENFDSDFLVYEQFMLESGSMKNQSVPIIAERNGTVIMMYQYHINPGSGWQKGELMAFGYQTIHFDMANNFTVVSIHDEIDYEFLFEGLRLTYNTTTTQPIALSFKIVDRITGEYWTNTSVINGTGMVYGEVRFWSPGNYFVIAHPYDLYIYNASNLDKVLWKVAIDGSELFPQDKGIFTYHIPITAPQFFTGEPIDIVSDPNRSLLYVLSTNALVVMDRDPLYQMGDQISVFQLNHTAQVIDYDSTNQRLYLGCNDSILLLNMTDPAKPVLIDALNLSITEPILDLERNGDYLFAAIGNIGLHTIYYNSSSQKLVYLQNNTFPSSQITSVRYSATLNQVYLAVGSLIYSSTPNSSMLMNNFNLIANLSSNTTSIAQIDLIEARNLLVATTNIQDGINIINVLTSETQQVSMGIGYGDPTDIAITGNYLYVGMLNNRGVLLFDLTNLDAIPNPVFYGNVNPLKISLLSPYLFSCDMASQINAFTIVQKTEITLNRTFRADWWIPGSNLTYPAKYTITIEPIFEYFNDLLEGKVENENNPRIGMFNKQNYADIWYFNMDANRQYAFNFLTETIGKHAKLTLFPGNTQRLNTQLNAPFFILNTETTPYYIFNCTATGKYLALIEPFDSNFAFLQSNSQFYKFFISIVPIEPILRTPQNAEYISPSNGPKQSQIINFTWSAGAGDLDVLFYHIQIANQSNFSTNSLIVNTTTAKTAAFFSYNFTNQGRYYWRVRVIDDSIIPNIGPWSVVNYINFDNERPLPPMILPISNNYNRSNFLLSWNVSDDGPFPALRYYVYQIDISRTITSLTPNGIYQTQLEITNLRNGRYYFFVVAEDNVGYLSENSELVYTTITIGGFVSAVGQPFTIQIGDILLYQVTNIISSMTDSNQNPVMIFEDQRMIPGTQIEFWVNYFNREDEISIQGEFAMKLPDGKNFNVINNFTALTSFVLSTNSTYQGQVFGIYTQNLIPGESFTYRSYETLWRRGTDVFEVYVHTYFSPSNNDGKQSSASYFVEKSSGVLCEMTFYNSNQNYGYSLQLVETTTYMNPSDWRFAPIYYGLTMIFIVMLIGAVIRKVEY
jgi:hypothetical protein